MRHVIEQDSDSEVDAAKETSGARPSFSTVVHNVIMRQGSGASGDGDSSGRRRVLSKTALSESTQLLEEPDMEEEFVFTYVVTDIV